MPTNVATVSASTLRVAVAQDMRAYRFQTTTSAGNAGGTTLVCSACIGDDTDLHINKWILLTSGTYAGQFRQVSSFTNASGTFTVRNAFGGQIATSVTFEIYTFEPSDFTLASNKAIQKNVDSIFRVYYDYVITDIVGDLAHKTIGVPRNIIKISRLFMESQTSAVFEDYFNRAAAASLGGDWTNVAGTGGVTGERLYSDSDADADMFEANQVDDLPDGMIEAIVRGTLASSSTYRAPVLYFRMLEDYAGARDTQNYLLIRLLATATNSGGAIDLRKVDAGTESSLSEVAVTSSNGVDYVLRVRFEGNRIRVWVDDNLLIDYELTGLNLKYLEGVRAGIRWDKAGSPATAARVDNYRVHSIVPFMELHDWEQSSDLRTLRVPAKGRHNLLLPDRYVMVEGTGFLTLLTANTTAGDLVTATDTAAVLQITTTEHAWRLLIAAVKKEMYDIASQPGGPYDGDESDQQRYAQFAQSASAELEALKRSHSMPIPAPSYRRP